MATESVNNTARPTPRRLVTFFMLNFTFYPTAIMASMVVISVIFLTRPNSAFINSLFISENQLTFVNVLLIRMRVYLVCEWGSVRH